MITDLHVPRLNRENGVYVSPLRYDSIAGYFYKTVLVPTVESGEPVIIFKKERRGFRVLGEAHIVTGRTEYIINSRVKEVVNAHVCDEKPHHRRLLPREYDERRKEWTTKELPTQ